MDSGRREMRMKALCSRTLPLLAISLLLITVVQAQVPGDLNSDGYVNETDLLLLVGNWHTPNASSEIFRYSHVLEVSVNWYTFPTPTPTETGTPTQTGTPTHTGTPTSTPTPIISFLMGVVRDSITGERISGAFVRLTTPGASINPYLTLEDGAFLFTGIPGGFYDFTVTKSPEYVTFLHPDMEIKADNPPYDVNLKPNVTLTPTSTFTSTGTPTSTPIPTDTWTHTPTLSPTPSGGPTATNTATPTDTPTSTNTLTPTPIGWPTATPTATSTPTNTSTPPDTWTPTPFVPPDSRPELITSRIYETHLPENMVKRYYDGNLEALGKSFSITFGSDHSNPKATVKYDFLFFHGDFDYKIFQSTSLPGRMYFSGQVGLSGPIMDVTATAWNMPDNPRYMEILFTLSTDPGARYSARIDWKQLSKSQ
jgi:hypothetical protein